MLVVAGRSGRDLLGAGGKPQPHHQGNLGSVLRRLISMDKKPPSAKARLPVPPAAVAAVVKTNANTRTLAMVLRSERELLAQSKAQEDEIAALRLQLENKDREVERLKDLCLRQREEIRNASASRRGRGSARAAGAAAELGEPPGLLSRLCACPGGRG